MEIPAVDPRSTRLYGLVARKARRAAIFRRGPSRAVRLILWHLDMDVLEPGQWFKGRIYERRCDLSEDGSLLAYFAATYRRPYFSWTAVSRPPWLTALALWPKGDGWGGGALFGHKSTALQLNHRPKPHPPGKNARSEMQLANGFSLPEGMQIAPLGEGSGWGEDDPIRWLRMQRDGWRHVSGCARRTGHGNDARFWTTYDSPVVIEKTIGAGPHVLRLREHAMKEQQGRWYVETAAIADDRRGEVELGRVDWTDTDHNGDVLYAAEGRLFRIDPARALRSGDTSAAKLVADLNAMQFEAIESPLDARAWR